MAEMPENEFVEVRNGGYYVRGTRIHLDILVHGLRRGETAETLLEAYPSMGSLEKVNAAIAFIQNYPEAVQRYMEETDALWEKFKREHPMPEDVRKRYGQARKELERRSA
jgi:uncharacterized protein (DUF433 family)